MVAGCSRGHDYSYSKGDITTHTPPQGKSVKDSVVARTMCVLLCCLPHLVAW